MLYDHLNTFIFQSALPQLKSMYPNSLDLGKEYVQFLLDRVHGDSIEPHIAVSFSMLDKNISATNYESEIIKRNRSQQDSSAEVVGYTQSTLLLVAFFLTVEKILPESGKASTEDIEHDLSMLMPSVPGFTALPRDLQANCMRFIKANVLSVMEELKGNADVDIRDVVSKTAERAERDNPNATARRGAQTAQDTFMLYFELVSRIPPRWLR
jgi:hypothetical protein